MECPSPFKIFLGFQEFRLNIVFIVSRTAQADEKMPLAKNRRYWGHIKPPIKNIIVNQKHKIRFIGNLLHYIKDVALKRTFLNPMKIVMNAFCYKFLIPFPK
jgi:hypothetical protein